jgi:ribosome modulation factor
MKRPPFEVADIIRAHGDSFVEKSRSWLTWLHLRVLFAIEHCRTAALGGHLDRCLQCGYEATSFNSCRSRHCPKCQTNARDKWLAGRSQELLPVHYVHVVFTIPHELSWLTLHNKKVVYDLLFHASAATLLEIAANPKHLGAEIGFLSVLHTWGQNLQHHPHIHCGSLCQKALRRARTYPSLLGPLHASHRHLQPPDRELCRRQGHFPLEGL